MSRILLVGPYPLYRLGVANLLRHADSRMTIVEATSLAQLPLSASREASGLLICGQEMSPAGLAPYQGMRACNRNTRRVLFTDCYGKRHHQMLQHGLFDLILPLSVSECVATHYLSRLFREQEPEVGIAALQDPTLAEAFLPDLYDLTRRELKLLAHLRQGLSNEVIASRMAININTVKVHMANIYRKTGIRNRTHAVSLYDQMLSSRYWPPGDKPIAKTQRPLS